MFHIIKIKPDASNTMPSVLHLQFNSLCLDMIRMQRGNEGYFVTCPTIVKHLIRFDCILHVILILRPPSRYSLPVLSQAHRAGGHGEEQFLRKRLSDITSLDTQHTHFQRTTYNGSFTQRTSLSHGLLMLNINITCPHPRNRTLVLFLAYELQHIHVLEQHGENRAYLHRPARQQTNKLK